MVFALNKKNVKTIIGLLFVISGMAGLIYQIVWFKYLGLFLGNTTYAQITVLATFLGGLALGNFLFGRNADAVKNPVRVYSLLELTIGLYCFSYPTLSSILGNVFLSMSSNLNLETQLFVFNSFRFLISAILLLIPTALMGGTLPVLSKFFVEKISESRKEVALLYFLNSFGAVIGVIFAGFILIKDFGLEITNYTTAAINILLGVAAFALSFSIKNFPAEVKPLTEVPEEQAHNKNISSKVIILVAGISGMAALLYEMVWTRLLINFFGSSTYAFSIMLLSFIGGITIGSFIISLKFLSKFNYVKLLSFCQAAIALSTIAVLSLYERLPYYLWRFSALLNKSDETF
ncbi:MAG: fused MFS/spermidine synthase, partial [Bacteroidota bacterium]